MHRRAASLLCAVVVIGLAAMAAAQVVRVYEMRHRTAEELVPLVETAMTGEGRVSADRRTNSLVLSGSPRAVASALELLRSLDVRPRTVVLHYEARSSGELAAGGASVKWRVGAGSFRVADVSWPTGAAALAIDAESEASRRSSTLAGQLRILDGQTGQIATGASLPITTRRIQRSGRVEVVEEATHYVSAQAGFEASPRVLRDGQVELALRPFDESLRPGGAIQRASADTVLVLTPGATVAIGGIVREQSSQRGAFSGGGARGESEQSVLLVTVEVE